MAGATLTPGTEDRVEDAESTMALSALDANTSIGGVEKRGIGGISPARYPGTVGVAEAVAVGDGVGEVVAASCVGEGAASFGLDEPQAPRAREAAVMRAAVVRVRRVMVIV